MGVVIGVEGIETVVDDGGFIAIEVGVCGTFSFEDEVAERAMVAVEVNGLISDPKVEFCADGIVVLSCCDPGSKGIPSVKNAPKPC